VISPPAPTAPPAPPVTAGAEKSYSTFYFSTTTTNLVSLPPEEKPELKVTDD